jgi:hypothetical protein
LKFVKELNAKINIMNKLTESLTCCPELNPDLWDMKYFDWNDKKFIADKVFTLLYVPLNFGAAMKRFDKRLRDAGATSTDGLCLSLQRSKWSMELLLAVDGEITGADNRAISGRIFSKVYEGAYNNTGKWWKDFKQVVAQKGHVLKNCYMWYTTCPKCAKKYGKNHVVIFGELG